MSSQSDFKKELENMLNHYLAHLVKYEKKGARNFFVEELEIRFKPHGKKYFNKTDYDKVISRLKSCDFETKNPDGLNMLRIMTQYMTETGSKQMSNIRTELCGSDIIQEYCRTDEDLNKLLSFPENINKIKFTQKTPAKAEGEEKPIPKIDNRDFKFNVSFNLETDYRANYSKDNRIKDITSSWMESKKTFRLLNRVRFENDNTPIAVDLTILRTSKTTTQGDFSKYVPEHSIHDSGLFQNHEICEIELEVINNRVGIGTFYNTPEKIIAEIQRVVKHVLSGLQSSRYPISYQEQDEVIQSYMSMIYGEDFKPRRVISRDFIGPSSCTLQIKNIIETENSSEPNIRNGFCVTDKADGERKMLYINKEGRVYLIDTNLCVEFTGSKVDRNKFGNTLIDGEHILYDKTQKYKNIFAAFDVYFVNGKSVRDLNFWILNSEEEVTEEMKEKHRYSIMIVLIYNINKSIKSVIKDGISTIEINAKSFYFGKNIFKECAKLLADKETYPYETDGLIFTPINTGVGGMAPKQASKMERITWPLSLKWKPPQFNTIDFLVEYKTDKSGKEIIFNKFVDGINMTSTSIYQFRTIVLMCGFNRKTHMIVNPFQDLLDDNIPKMSSEIDNEDAYIPVPFIPNTPYDSNACFANIDIEQETGKMRTLSGELFEKDMIVEFSYDIVEKKWIPLRVRHDKTYSYRMGNKNYGNAYHVANDNWKSIHYPVEESMLRGINIPDEITNNDIYYNRTENDTSYTDGLRNFHNLYVKKHLIVGVSKPEDTLIDYAVGKGGDISKWKEARLKFVFGVDVSEDNIYNQNDGVCTRYLNERKQNKNLFDAIFLPADSRLNLRNGSAFSKDKLKDIAGAVFGSSKGNMGKAVAKNQGIGQKGFNISSCQFALHYFFENKTVLHNFLQNVSECTSVGGYFIGTCYDGQTVFNKLLKMKVMTKENSDSLNMNDSYSIYVEGKIIFDIQKKYSQTGFSNDDTSVGYPINVYQESINKYATEYLVNFEYLKQIMENYGFVVLNKAEANILGFPDGSGLFKDLFKQMNAEKNTKNYGKASNMRKEEMEISFLNRYFIFKKIHNVDAKKIQKSEKVEVFESEVKEIPKSPKMYIKRLNKKVVLQKYEEIEEAKKPEAKQPEAKQPEAKQSESNNSDEMFVVNVSEIMKKYK